MKTKRIYYIAVPFLIVIIALLLNFFSWNINSTGVLFGNQSESPIKSEVEKTKAFEIQDTFRKIFDLYKNTVVFITTEQIVKVRHPFFDDPVMREFFGKNNNPQVRKRTGLGTGFIISEDGYICTNHHVINGMDKINVNINDKNYEAKIIGSDEKTDIGLLKIEPKEKLQPAYFGDSDRVQVGDWAIAIGNPFGLDKTFTVGVISAVGRRDVDFMGGAHIQTDASINPGNSGGPLINIYGEVIGINRMIYSKSGGYMGIGFAIPINTAKAVLLQLQKYKKVKRGYLGVNIFLLSDEDAKKLGLPNNEGAFVGEVMENSPAHIGGILVGDIILKVNNTDIKSSRDLIDLIEKSQIGDTLKVVVLRNRKIENLSVKIKERP
ncbi:MAG: putative serine protease HtrA [Spirochaetes bacterium ADurb.Bin218]|jgi:Do/DeqQ family serine protease|nr:MAG: putative serine protease HtrA [Spirochaetes bacterium ADurb.Bin218]HOQ11387.1 trypsin-like peptidase domain-containing protein [Spirochaetota bacterium]HOV09531.1 trypsin-like peptidase domain-containing protein [Spirochaetota bacterium]